MSSLMQRPTGPTLEGQTANLRRQATANPAFRPEFRRSVLMHPVVAGVVAALVFVIVVALAMTQKPMYYAESLIYIEPFNSKVLPDGTGGQFDATKYDSLIAQQMLTAQRADIIVTALNTLPKQVWAAYGPNPLAAAGSLQGQFKIARVTTSYQVSISLKGPDAANTAAIVNAVTTAYLEAGRRDEISQADQRSQLLSEERGRIEQELAKTRAEQTQLGTQLGIANPGVNGANPYDSQLDALRQQLVSARASHDQAAAQLASISGVNGNHTSSLTAAANEVIGGDPGLGSMKSTINQRRAQITSQMVGLTPNNPNYKSYQDELADLDKTLDSMTVQLRDRAARQLQDKLRTELERTSDVESRINSQLARQTSSATTASPRLQRAEELTADVQRLTARYTTVDNALHSLQLETSGPGMAHLALAAATPGGPEPSKRRMLLLAALPLALLAGLFAAVFMRKRDKRVYTGNDVDDVLGFAPIAMLPARAEVSTDVLEEYFLRLAAGVEGAYRTGNARTFVVTAVSTSTDIAPLVQALDRKLVELGLGVVILHADEVFEQRPQAATTSELAGYDPAFDRHYEGLADTLFSRMKAEHDVILLESPALLISAQTEYVARCSDVTLMIAESAVTTRGELYQAGVLLQRLNVTGVGSVIEEIQLQYADSAFARGVRALEGRSRPVRRERQPVVVEAAPAHEAPVEVHEPVVASYAPPVIEEEPAHEPISVEPTPDAWYPDHAVSPIDAIPEAHSPAVSEDVHVVEPVLTVDPVAHTSAPENTDMGLFDSIEPASQRRSGSLFGSAESAEHDHEEEPAPTRGWFKRIFQRDDEPTFSIIPDNNDEEEAPAAPAMAHDPSRFDLPLPVEPASNHDWQSQTQTQSFSEPVHAAEAAHFEPVPELVPAPVAYHPEPVVEVAPLPVAQIVEAPLPEPIIVAPAAITPAPVVAAAPAAPATEPASMIYAFSPAAVAHVAPEPVVAAPIQQAVVEQPTRPLSFRELSQLNQPAAPVVEAAPEPQAPPAPRAFQHFEAPAPEPIHVEQPVVAAEAPTPVVEPQPEPEQHFEPAVEPQPESVAAAPEPAVATPAPSGDDWNPAPLNRWDPIPPLRQQEPWRISSGSTRAAQQQPPRDVWRGEDPVRIPPADRWVSAESLPAEAPPAESTDVVLTRRWGLLSRFQQGESFQSSHAGRRPAARQEQPQTEEYAQDFGQDYDPEYDRQGR